MPERPLTIATYAAGASLAAATLIYVFGPTYFLDEGAPSTKKNGVVGLSNAANDCFINSVLQALAGLPDLRLYLIRETHRRKLDGHAVYSVDVELLEAHKRGRTVNLEGLQKGMVTFALKEILDSLNERPLQKKVISPQPFIRALELAFSTRISRQQQDAQEFLQIVMERLCDEYHAGIKARRLSRAPTPGDHADDETQVDPLAEEGYPMEGKIESQIECLTCAYKPKPSVSSFVTLTLNVPQNSSSTTLNACFDGIFKVEHIDDFKCEYCCLVHAIECKEKEISRVSSATTKQRLESDIARIRDALKNDPEQGLDDMELPDPSLAPRRKIARHMYISSFPKVLAIHLSRSVFAVGNASSKNMAKVSFPETLPLGRLLEQKIFRLLGVVCHKGSHNSGHYESFRRQVQTTPFSTPISLGTEGVYSAQASPSLFADPSPTISTSNLTNDRGSPYPSTLPSTIPSTPTLHSSVASLSSKSSLPSLGPAPTPAPRQDDAEPSVSSYPESTKTKSIRSFKQRVASVADKTQELKRKHRSKQRSDRWWRISDERIKESKTGDVLGMQKEVYLLFYELERR